MDMKMEKAKNERYFLIFLKGNIIKSDYYNLNKIIIYVLLFFFSNFI